MIITDHKLLILCFLSSEHFFNNYSETKYEDLLHTKGDL